MKMIDINRILEKGKESGELPERTLAAIEKLVGSEGSFFAMMEETLKEMELDGRIGEMNKEAAHYIENKAAILTEMVNEAYRILHFKGDAEMVEFLENNYDISRK